MYIATTIIFGHDMWSILPLNLCVVLGIVSVAKGTFYGHGVNIGCHNVESLQRIELRWVNSELQLRKLVVIATIEEVVAISF